MAGTADHQPGDAHQDDLGAKVARIGAAELHRGDPRPLLRHVSAVLKLGCPFCGAGVSSVYHSRPGDGGYAYRRRRQCGRCRRTWPTIELTDHARLARELLRASDPHLASAPERLDPAPTRRRSTRTEIEALRGAGAADGAALDEEDRDG